MVDQAEVKKLFAVISRKREDGFVAATSEEDVSAVRELLSSNPGLALAKGNPFDNEEEDHGDQSKVSALRLLLQCKSNEEASSCEMNAQIVQMLIAAGADVNENTASDPNIVPLLMIAIGNEDTRDKNITGQLIAAGADVNAVVRMGGVLLRMLRFTIEEKGLLGGSAMFDEFQMFLAAGADVNALNSEENGDTVTNLFLATCNGFTRMMGMLIEKGAAVNALSVNVSNEHKWMKQIGSRCTPIMVAALKGDMEAVVILLQADADVTIKSSDGKTAADIAADNGHGDVAQVLSLIVKAQSASSGVDCAEANSDGKVSGKFGGKVGVVQEVIDTTANSLEQLTIIAQQAATTPAAEAATPPSSVASAPQHTLPTTTKFTLAALQTRSPETAACDAAHLHLYLSDADFQKVFGMSATDFGKLPGWKQTDAKKKHQLF